jgi:glycolate oxidase
LHKPGRSPDIVAYSELHSRLWAALGSEAVLTTPENLVAFSFDAYSDSRLPDVVVVPRDARDVGIVVRIAAELGIPVVPRGAGTGLCGGAVPVNGGVVLSFVRMNRILEIDPMGRWARVQPGVVNLALSHAVEPHGLFYAPDPSSQKISTIGGNVGTNAGGAHCLFYGTTVNHVLAVEYVDWSGEVHRASIDDLGYDLAGVLVGSEGTLGIVTSVDVKLMRVPHSTRVCVGAFADVESASAAVSAIIAAGIVPTAMEIMDRLITRAVEAHYHAGYPADAGAVLLVETAGFPDDMAALDSILATIARQHGALSWRSASDAVERAALWESRKGAAGAIGRLAPNYYIQDATVPRTRLPEAIARIDAIVAEHALQVGNVFHAGDGNLHPLLLFDRREERQVQAVVEAGTEILRACISLGGTISGEHGIGHEKRDTLSYVFSADDLATMGRVRDVFDPARLFNPDKIFPSGSRCGEVTGAPAAVARAVAAGAWL